MDGDAAAGHVPAVLRPRQHAHLHRLHEPGLRLEQERSRHCAQQLLLGLLPDSDPGWPPGGPVTARCPLPAPRSRARLESSWGKADWELGDLSPGGWGHSCPLGAQHPSESSRGRRDGWTGWALCSTRGLLRRGVWLSTALENRSEEGWPEPTWLSPWQGLWPRSFPITALSAPPGSGVRRSSCCQPPPGASSPLPPHCSRTWAAPTWPS